MGKLLVEAEAKAEAAASGDSKANEPRKHDDEFIPDSYFGPDLPPNILFPDQLNKYLREQIQNLTLENGSLRRSLEEMQDEMKKKLAKPVVPIAGRASELASNKIVELSKKLREQNAELEGMKTRARDAEAKLRQVEANSIDQQSVAPPPSEDEIFEKEKQIKSLTEKLQISNSKMCDFRNQCQALRQELKLAQKVIENEVGEKAVFQDLAKENAGRRGRAQQIIALQNKVQHLQEQLSNTAVPETSAVNVLRQLEKDRRASYEETTKQLTQKTIQVEEMRKKLEASRARNKVLENEIIQIKTKLSSVIDKGIKDEQLIASLTSQINVFEDRGKAQSRCFSKMQDTINKLQQDLDIERDKNEQIQKALVDRENKNQRLQTQIEELRKLKNQHADNSPTSTPKKFEENKREPNTALEDLQFGSNKKALSVVDSERMRLLELLAVVNRRLDDCRREQMNVEAQLRKEKFKNAKLETKVARLELERVGVLKTGRGCYSHNGPKSGDIPTEEPDIIARQHIEYLEEECLALKTRIETLQIEKEDDLKIFAAMTDARETHNRKLENCSPAKKVNSFTDKKAMRKLSNKRLKHCPNKTRKSSPVRVSADRTHSSFSSEESLNSMTN